MGTLREDIMNQLLPKKVIKENHAEETIRRAAGMKRPAVSSKETEKLKSLLCASEEIMSQYKDMVDDLEEHVQYLVDSTKIVREENNERGNEERELAEHITAQQQILVEELQAIKTQQDDLYQYMLGLNTKIITPIKEEIDVKMIGITTKIEEIASRSRRRSGKGLLWFSIFLGLLSVATSAGMGLFILRAMGVIHF